MKNRINIASRIRLARLQDIVNFTDNFDGTATVTTSDWRTLPIHEGSARVTVESNHTNAGRQVRTSITARLKELMQLRCRGILEVTMCNGETYIIGTPDLPVSIDQTNTLTQKSIQINHQNTVFPPLKAV